MRDYGGVYLRNFKEELNKQMENSAYSQPSVVSKVPVDFAKIKVGANTLDDAIFKLGDLKNTSNLVDKAKVLKAIEKNDIKEMRKISDFFYKVSGIYARILRYMAFMYRYDWMVTPYIYDKKIKNDKVVEGFWKCLRTLDDFGVKKQLGEIALEVMQHGVYYGFKVNNNGVFSLQQLPANYCRNRFNCGNKPAVEFNMKYFDEQFRNVETRMRILKAFPKEFEKGYRLYKEGKLPPEFQGDTSGWYLLDPKMTVRFTANGQEYPPFISVIPLIIDLDEAQAVDKKRMLQKILKIVIQKMPLDKNGEMIFDIDEARELHNNAVQMLGKAVGLDVLTTFADVEVADMDSTAASAQTDDLARVERQLYNEAGVSQMQFNTDGNLALEKSILNDEATIYNMLLQFEQFLNELLEQYNGNRKKLEYKVQLLTTTIYNYKELAKLYKEQVTLGYSKFLPQIALGQSQSSVLANAYFENEILDLINVFIPPLMSSTMNGDTVNKLKGGKQVEAEDKKAGRKELPDDQKSEKTLQNKESMN